MMSHPRFSLKLVTPPFLGRVLEVPPTLNASDHTVDFVCGLWRAGYARIHGAEVPRQQCF
jgi:hypothetical protein